MLLENEPDLEIVGESSSGMEALQMVQKLQPDIVIMDISLPDISGIETTQRLKQMNPALSIVALTIHEDPQYFFQMLQAGASAYVPKRAAPDDLINAIRTVDGGDVYIYPSLTKLLVGDFLARAEEGEAKVAMDGLTAREQEVLSLLAEGKTNDEIADALSISHHTVARHRENVMAKLELHSRSELVKYAIRKGLIKP
jgi:two-component system response regulator NreC